MNGLFMKYFVLKPNGRDIYASASRSAMLTYADAIMDDNKDFALDIIQWVQSEEKASQQSVEADKCPECGRETWQFHKKECSKSDKHLTA